jgi:hypothetical protein
VADDTLVFFTADNGPEHDTPGSTAGTVHARLSASSRPRGWYRSTRTNWFTASTRVIEEDAISDVSSHTIPPYYGVSQHCRVDRPKKRSHRGGRSQPWLARVAREDHKEHSIHLPSKGVCPVLVWCASIAIMECPMIASDEPTGAVAAVMLRPACTCAYTVRAIQYVGASLVVV